MRKLPPPGTKTNLALLSLTLGLAVITYLLARGTGQPTAGSAVLGVAVALMLAGGWLALTWRRDRDVLRSAWQQEQEARRQSEDRVNAALLLHQEQIRHQQETLNAQQILISQQTEELRCKAEDGRRLQAVLRFNHSLAEARDEKAIMDVALSTIQDLVGALGCSYVPLDMWEQPLPPFTYGQLPSPVLSAWAQHVMGTALRERCASCAVLHSTPGECPLHPSPLGTGITVFCLPLHRRDVDQREHTLGMLNLYLPTGLQLDNEMRSFLEGLLQAMALAMETMRLRSQESTTLRQIQMVHNSEGSLSDSLGGLLENLQEAMDTDTVWLRLRASADRHLASLSVLRGPALNLPAADVETIFNQVLLGESACAVLPAADAMHSNMLTTNLSPSAGYWFAVPVSLPNGTVLGMLLVWRARALPFHQRQEAILQTVAAQAALLVENERMLHSLEYRAMIQERTRLAREIHDGLAQTLAYLKLQAAQMQSYLAQGELSRLSQVLKDNYKALAEAYLDTRQAIDNLRLTPHNGMETALVQIADEFETTLHIPVEQNIQVLSDHWQLVVTPEVQAQMVRIVQEALNNVRKHSRAQRVWLNVRDGQDALFIEIGDDGQGFDVDDVPEISQHGLRGMRERSELIGADFQIISKIGQGTMVQLALPDSLMEKNP